MTQKSIKVHGVDHEKLEVLAVTIGAVSKRSKSPNKTQAVLFAIDFASLMSEAEPELFATYRNILKVTAKSEVTE